MIRAARAGGDQARALNSEAWAGTFAMWKNFSKNAIWAIVS
jgi:hypothetical protein